MIPGLGRRDWQHTPGEFRTLRREKNTGSLATITLQPLLTVEKNMATHSSILAWGNPMDRRAWRVKVHGVTKESYMTEAVF